VSAVQFDQEALEPENRRLKNSLKRCHAMLDEYRSKVAANANGDYRPPYEADDAKSVSRDGEAS
jgi:hypothetical protein